jgi:hypothetical protein
MSGRIGQPTAMGDPVQRTRCKLKCCDMSTPSENGGTQIPSILHAAAAVPGHANSNATDFLPLINGRTLLGDMLSTIRIIR